MTKRAITAGALALATLGLGGYALAQGPGHRSRGPEGPGFGPPIGRLAEKLGLSDDQKQQLEALREKHREALKPLLEAARASHEAFDAALEAENADATRIGRAALSMKAARAKLDAAHKAGFEEMKALLTPEQAEKLEAARERGFGPGDGPRGRRGFGRRPPLGGPEDDPGTR